MVGDTVHNSLTPLVYGSLIKFLDSAPNPCRYLFICKNKEHFFLIKKFKLNKTLGINFMLFLGNKDVETNFFLLISWKIFSDTGTIDMHLIINVAANLRS